MQTYFWRSLRWQIQFYYTVILILVVGILVGGFYVYERGIRLRDLDNEIITRIHPVIPPLMSGVLGMGHPGDRGRGGPGRDGQRGRRGGPGEDGQQRGRPEGRGGEGRGEGGPRGQFRHLKPPRGLGPARIAIPAGTNDEIQERLNQSGRFQDHIGPLYVVFWTHDGKRVYRSPKAPDVTEMPHLDGRQKQKTQWRGDDRELVVWDPNGIILFGMDREHVDEQLSNFAWRLTGIGVAVVVVFSLAGWFLLARGLRPIADISETAQNISDGDLQKRIPTGNIHNELGPLAGLLNETFGRLDDAIQAQRHYNANASHEMRTPLAIIIADCDYSLKRERPAERYLKTIRTCRETAQHMAALVEDLNLLAKADASALKLQQDQDDLAELMEEVALLAEPLCGEKRLTLEKDLQPAPARFDRKLLRQVCVNLIGNAARYNKPDGKIILRTGQRGGRSFAEVEDTGIGIPAEQLPHIFERFYHGEEARDQVRERTGLGLAISKAIVEAHQGEIRASSTENTGTCIRLELPATKARG